MAHLPVCSYCGGKDFFEGPSGGMSINSLCSNMKCRHWFNWTPELESVEDLKKVEPSEEEKVEEKRKRDAEPALQYKEGREAFQKGVPLNHIL